MANVWFTADTHFSHEFVAKTRGYVSADEHDEALVERWNSIVKPRDIVWHLGDVSITRSPARWQPWVAKLHGTKHLVSGNHDGTFPGARSAYKDMRHYLEHFETVQSTARRRYNGVEFLLSHFPYDGDTAGREVERYDQYRLRDLGVPLVHGHTHRDSVLSESHLGTPQIHVGQDATPFPAHLDEIGSYLLRTRSS